MRVIVVGIAVALMVLTAGPPASAAAVVAAQAQAQIPVRELTSMCAGKVSGLLRAVASPSGCNSLTETRVTLPADAPLHVCRLQGDRIRRVSAPSQCVAGETPLTLPGTGPSFFCALVIGGFLRAVTAPSQCTSTETPQVVSVPVANGDAFSVNEDTTLTRPAPGVLANDSDALGNPLTAQLVTGPSQAASFVLNGNGSFTYTPNAQFAGADSFTYRVTDGSYTSAPATVAITVTPVNDAPGFTKGPDQMVNRDAGPQTVNPWATAISAGPANESSQALTFSVTSTNPGLFSAAPAVSPAGALSYTPTAGTSGAAAVTVVLRDNGGTANGGADTSAPQTFTITVVVPNAVPVADNDAYTVNEDGVLNQAAPGVLDGDTDADGDPLTAVPAVGPAQASSFTLNGDGSFAYTPNADFCGTDSFTYRADDGTADSSTATVTLTVTCVNDAPSFIEGPDQTVSEDAGPQTVDPWATAISAGPPDESGQTVTFTVTGNTNPALFSAGPAVSPAGVLTYTPAANANGSAAITLTLQDNGAPPATSPAQTFTITVTPVNDVPLGVVNQSHTVTGNVRIQVPPTAGLLLGVTDIDGDSLVAQVDGTNASTGDVTINGDGSYVYNPKPGREGTDVVKFKVCDSGTPSACSPVRDLTLTVSNMIWFIDHNAGPGGTGRLTNPFNSIGAFTAVNNGTGDNPAAGDTIFIDRTVATSYTGPLTLLNGQKVIGKGASVPITAAAGIMLAPDSDPLPATGGTSPIIKTAAAGANGITLASGNTLRGLTVGDTAGSGIAGTDFGTLLVLETAVNGPGRALNLTNGSFAAGSTFTEVTSTSGPTGISLDNVNGNLTILAGSLSGSTGAELDVNLGNGTISYPGAITSSAGRAVSIRNRTGGTFTLAGPVGDTGGSGTGVLLDNNDNATVAFTGGLTLSTGANPAFTATNGGTVTVTGISNTLATTTGTALTVANTTIGAVGLTFTSVSSNGAASGIVLDSTGSSGGLTVAGTGAPASGGTIQASTADGIRLTNTSKVALSWMDVKTSADNGINGTLVTDLSLTSLRIQNNTNGLVEAGLLLTNLRGTNSVTNTEVSGSTEDNVRVLNNSGTLGGITFSGAGCLIKDNSTASGNVGINVQANQTAVMNGVNVSGCTFTGNRTVSLRGDVADSSQLTITAQNNVFRAGSPNRGNQGIDFSAAGTGVVTYDINTNKIGTDGVTDAPLGNTGINVFAGNNSTMTGKVRDNTVNAGAGVNGFGIRVFQSLNSALRANVSGNTVRNVGLDYGILAEGSGGSSPAAGQARLDVALTGNNVSVLPGALDAIRAQARNVNTACARISANTTNAGGTGYFGLFVRQANTAVFNLEGLSGAVNTYLAAQNPAAATAGSVGTISAVPANSCNIPN